MSERKVLNKYYPPDFDPAKIPRMKLAKNRQYTVRLMAPFNMRCVTCGEYIYKGKKFNARKEDVEDQTYLGIRIYRFYIKCTRCLQEISFKTDPQNTDYEIEAGATRNFMALKLAEEQAKREEDDLKEEEASNPMKLLENRTQQSRNEIELLESLEELKDLNRRQQRVDYDSMLERFNTTETEREREERLERLDEEFIKGVNFHNKGGVKRVAAEEIVELDEKKVKTFESAKAEKPTTSAPSVVKVSTVQTMSVGGFSNKNLMKNLIKAKAVPTATATTDNVNSNTKTESASTNALSLLTGYSDSDESDDN
ncbi:splicing factor YJU2 [Bradysia coprophila]|uniref:splicing factor YJU2 n=1 Tax=Bradysia coprophila TaxID=38358 RepID=UPI00187D8BC2|nr:splicing factor YJU2 [Bradysia coprophila]